MLNTYLVYSKANYPEESDNAYIRNVNKYNVWNVGFGTKIIYILSSYKFVDAIRPEAMQLF